MIVQYSSNRCEEERKQYAESASVSVCHCVYEAACLLMPVHVRCISCFHFALVVWLHATEIYIYIYIYIYTLCIYINIYNTMSGAAE